MAITTTITSITSTTAPSTATRATRTRTRIPTGTITRRKAGATRSVRLPRALDDWFDERLALHPERTSSELLVTLVHGGLRLREGYMAIHRRVLEHYVATEQPDVYAAYRRCLLDTFGPDYVEHLERWLAADGVAKTFSS